MTFTFRARRRPFDRWFGPFSPARGTYSGFRFHNGHLGTWVANDIGREFWPVVDSPGNRALSTLVRNDWGGGRVLFLPTGLVVKPLPGNELVGRRVLIGRFSGSIILEKPDGTIFDLSDPGSLRPGDPWPGPGTTGLECAVRQDGSLDCTWYHPVPGGRDEFRRQVRGADRRLIQGFRAARPNDTGGRVRITANGHIITNRQGDDGNWNALYVGYAGPDSWPDWDELSERSRQ